MPHQKIARHKVPTGAQPTSLAMVTHVALTYYPMQVGSNALTQNQIIYRPVFVQKVILSGDVRVTKKALMSLLSSRQGPTSTRNQQQLTR